MADYELIDAHAHTYKTAEAGINALGGARRNQYAGTLDEYLSVMSKCSISKVVMVNFVPIPEMRQAALARLPKDLSPAQLEEAKKRIEDEMVGRVIRRNEWTCEIARENPNLVPLIAVDPSMSPEAKAAEIEDRVKNGGAKGVKAHPPVQRFFADDEIMFPAYAKASELEVPVVFHSGGFNVPDGKEYARTKLFAAVLSAFPKLTVVLAHLGGVYSEEALDLAKRYHNVCFDSSAALSGPDGKTHLTDAEAVRLIRSIGVERVMFGTDFAFFDPAAAAERFATLPLTLEEKRLIGAENAKRIFKF